MLLAYFCGRLAASVKLCESGEPARPPPLRVPQHLGRVLANGSGECALTPRHLPTGVGPGCRRGLKKASYFGRLWLQFQAHCLVVLALWREGGSRLSGIRPGGLPPAWPPGLSSGPPPPPTWLRTTQTLSAPLPFLSMHLPRLLGGAPPAGGPELGKHLERLYGSHGGITSERGLWRETDSSNLSSLLAGSQGSHLLALSPTSSSANRGHD